MSFFVLLSLVIGGSGLLSKVHFQFVEHIYIPSHAAICSVIVLPNYQSVYQNNTNVYANHFILAMTDGTVGIWNGTYFVTIIHPMQPNYKLNSFVLATQCNIFQRACRFYMHKAECRLSKNSYCTYSVGFVYIFIGSNGTFVLDEFVVFSKTDVYSTKENTQGSVVVDYDNPSMIYVTTPHHMLRLQISDCPNPGMRYCIPPTNPFGNEIYAIGFHNLGSCYIDSVIRKPICIDSGNTHSDEVNIIYIRGDYGWPIREGEKCVSNPNCYYPRYYEFPNAISQPIGNLVGGFIFRGSKLSPSFKNKYVSFTRNNMIVADELVRNKVKYFRFAELGDYQMVHNTRFIFQDGNKELYTIRLISSDYYNTYYSLYGLTSFM